MPVEVKGAIATRKALRQFEPDLAKETTKEIASFLKPVVRQARGYAPSNEQVPSGWVKRPNAGGRWAERSYDAAEVRRGITYKSSPSKPNRNGFRSLATIYNKSAAGAIYETAGRKSGLVGKFSPKLGGQIKGKNAKNSGRVIFRAVDEDEGKARGHIIKAIEKAANKLNSRSAL
jgi:hypothetical protein